MTLLYPNATISDEKILTTLIAKSYNKRSFVLGSTLVSHFSYSTDGQVQYLSKTNILGKYKKLANDYFNNNFKNDLFLNIF